MSEIGLPGRLSRPPYLIEVTSMTNRPEEGALTDRAFDGLSDAPEEDRDADPADVEAIDAIARRLERSATR